MMIYFDFGSVLLGQVCHFFVGGCGCGCLPSVDYFDFFIIYPGRMGSPGYVFFLALSSQIFPWVRTT